MIRRLFNLATTAAILLTVAVCVLWWRSYRVSEKVSWERDDGYRSLRSAPGRVVFNLHWIDSKIRAGDARGLKYTREEPSPVVWEIFTVLELCHDATARLVQWERGDFAWSHRRSSRDLIVTAVAPFWSVAAASGAMPMGWVALLLRSLCRARRRNSLGLCPDCGYDLRATPGRCPECGRPANAPVRD